MKKAILKSKKIVFLLAMLLLCNKYVSSANYTAVASGNWSSAATWGGTAPDVAVTSDQITIPAGITVTIDNNVMVDGTLAVLNIFGTLYSTANNSLAVNKGAIAGSGSISVSGLILDAYAIVTFNGQIAVDYFSTSSTNLSLEADMLVNETLTISNGILSLQLGGSLDVGANADIVISGGILSLNGGAIGLNSSYNVVYTNSSVTVGAELDGQGLNNVMIDVSESNTVTLNSDLNISGTLSLLSGTLVLNGNNLNITGNISSSETGAINSNSGSNIMINSITGVSGYLHFTSNGNTVNNLVLVLAVGSSVSLGSDLTIEGTLSLNGGSNLDISDQLLTIGVGGNISGTGSLIVNSSSGLVINSSSGIDAALSTYGSTIGTFTINTGSSSVTLDNNLVVSENLYLQSGNLVLNDYDLTISGDISTGGNGAISSTIGSNIIASGNSSMTGSLNFSENGNSVRDFSINIGQGNSLSIGSSLNIEGTLSLNGGSSINISGQTLSIGSGGDINGTGSIKVTATSSLNINADNGISTAVSFSGPGVGTYHQNTINGNVMLGSDLLIFNSLNIEGGILFLNSHDLIISGDIEAEGNGAISSTAASNIIINSSYSPSGALNFTSSGNIVNNLAIDVNTGNTVAIGSDLTVNGTLDFSSGSINVGNNILHIGSGGSINGSGSTSYVMTGLIGYLGIDLTAGTNPVIFPVGTANFYAPASISLNSGSASGNIYVGAMANVLANGSSGIDLSLTEPLVDATWNIESDITANLNMDLKLMWSDEMEENGFNRSAVYITHYTSGAWDESAGVIATIEADGMYSVQRENITSLSPFAVFDRSTSAGISEAFGSSFELFPNPTTDNIFIKNFGFEVNGINVDIINCTGEILQTVFVEKDHPNVLLTKFSPGNYFLKFYNEDLSVVKKVTKE